MPLQASSIGSPAQLGVRIQKLSSTLSWLAAMCAPPTMSVNGGIALQWSAYLFYITN
jgi:hypothetical protein